MDEGRCLEPDLPPGRGYRAGPRLGGAGRDHRGDRPPPQGRVDHEEREGFPTHQGAARSSSVLSDLPILVCASWDPEPRGDRGRAPHASPRTARRPLDALGDSDEDAGEGPRGRGGAGLRRAKCHQEQVLAVDVDLRHHDATREFRPTIRDTRPEFFDAIRRLMER